MNRNGHDNVGFFVGDEVERTPAHGKKTLFVVGVHSVEKIHQYLDNNPFDIEHIYFGANHSFPNLQVNDASAWAQWEHMINHFLDQGLWCTLDVDISCAEGLCESGLCERRQFIPMISAKLPYIQQLGYNATLKLDDRDFDATNPGVWCHSLWTLQSRRAFTSWDQYSQDKTL